MKKLKVAVLMGGKSSEHEISLISGNEVVKNLDAQKYEVVKVVIPKTGLDEKTIKVLTKSKIDLVFIALHGPNGEDGTIQGFLELLKIPYTGSGVLASAVGMDKVYSRYLFTQIGLNVPKFVIINKDENHNKVWKELKTPVFIHPADQGSAIGTSIVKKKADLKRALKEAYKYSDVAIVDEYIKGIEVTCAVLGSKNPKALPVVEIRPKHEYFDYEAKYDPSLTDEIVPAQISPELTQKVQDAARLAFQVIGCDGFGRTDIIIRGKDVYVLEVNTIPGLTPVSLFPKAAKAAGISYAKLLDMIIGYAQKPHRI